MVTLHRRQVGSFLLLAWLAMDDRFLAYHSVVLYGEFYLLLFGCPLVTLGKCCMCWVGRSWQLGIRPEISKVNGRTRTPHLLLVQLGETGWQALWLDAKTSTRLAGLWEVAQSCCLNPLRLSMTKFLSLMKDSFESGWHNLLITWRNQTVTIVP